MTLLETLLARSRNGQRTISNCMKSNITSTAVSSDKSDEPETKIYKLAPPGGNYSNQSFTRVLGPDNEPLDF